MNLQVDVERVFLAHKAIRAELLAERTHHGHWVGQLASSPLATAAAISALVVAHHRDSGETLRESLAGDGPMAEQLVQSDLSELLCESVQWLARHQNSDGGWGDCDTSRSNLAATMLVQAAFRMTGVPAKYADLIMRADRYIAAQGGAAGLRRAHTHGKTLVAAVLTNCALAGTVLWRQVPTLPFELSCLPKRWQRYLQMPYPRYATPALVAVGRAKFYHDPPRNPFTRLLRQGMRAKSLAILENWQAADDSFLGSTLLTSFVAISLASIGCQDHTIVRRGVEFLLASVRGDASWPVQADHAVTNTTLALSNLTSEDSQVATRLGARYQLPSDVAADTRPPRVRRGSIWQNNAQAADALSDDTAFAPARSDTRATERYAADGFPFNEQCFAWLLDNQRTEPNRLTEFPPGGWGWSDAPGALPNTVDTANALLALAHWSPRDGNAQRERIDRAVRLGIECLLGIQHDDGSWPTYHGGDRDSRLDECGSDVTAQALRALATWQQVGVLAGRPDITERIKRAIDGGWRFLESQQQEDGCFLPLWFGNEHQRGNYNPVYGTAQVLIACAPLMRLESELALRAAGWLVSAQHSTGGWGPPRARRDYSRTEKDGFRAWRANDAMAKRCSVEETALAVTALLPVVEKAQAFSGAVSAGLTWLAAAVEQDLHHRPAVVGFYLPKLWYYERLYPLVFAAGAFSRAIRQLAPQPHEIASAR